MGVAATNGFFINGNENSYGDAFVNRSGLLTDMQFIMLMGTKTGLP